MEINNLNSSSANDYSNTSHAFGAELKQARLDKNLSLEDVSAELFILKRHLQALEEENFAELPQAAFTRGFVINYAKFLGLDQHRIVAGFNTAYPEHLRKKSAEDIESPLQPMGTLQREGGRSWKINPLLVIGLILLIAFGIFLMRVVSNAQQRNAIEEENATLSEDLAMTDQVAGAYVPPNNTTTPTTAGSAIGEIDFNSSDTNSTDNGVDTPNTSESTSQESELQAAPSTSVVPQASTSATTAPNLPTTNIASLATTTSTAIPPFALSTSNTTTTPPAVAAIPVPAGQNSTLELWVQADTTIKVVDAAGNTLLNGTQKRGGYEVKGLPPFKVQIDNVNRVSLDLNQKKVRLHDYAQNNKANFTLGTTS